MQIQNAISRQRKEETVQQLESLLQDSAVVVGLRYQGLTVKQLQDFRRALPAQSKVLVCKNTLMRVACDKVEGWGELKAATKGDNAWLFVNEEVIAESIKAYVAFEKKLLEGVPKEERATARPIDVRCAAAGRAQRQHPPALLRCLARAPQWFMQGTRDGMRCGPRAACTPQRFTQLHL
jgi:large subunit ribosomal protein L10